MNPYKLKLLAANALSATLPLKYIFLRSKNRHIFAYHRVVDPEVAHALKMQDAMWTSCDTFRSDLEWMLDNGEIVDLDRILDFSSRNDRPLFSITFDDGWIDNYTNAYPLLLKYGVPATVFLVTSAIQTGNIFWVEDFLYKVAKIESEKDQLLAANALIAFCNSRNIRISKSLCGITRIAESFIEVIKVVPKKLRMDILQELYTELGLCMDPIKGEVLTWEQINEMGDNGISFGSHTHTHEILKYTDRQTSLAELIASKAIIERETNKPVKYFCYPNARYNEKDADLIESVGYMNAFRIHNLPTTGQTDRYFVPRYLASEHMNKNKNYLLCRLLGLPRY